MVAQESGGKMLHCVYGGLSDGRLFVGFFHADIESGDYVATIHIIFSRHIYAAEQFQVIDCKTGYFFHCVEDKNGLDALNQFIDDSKCMLWSLCPEVAVLLSVVVSGTRRVANDSYADEIGVV